MNSEQILKTKLEAKDAICWGTAYDFNRLLEIIRSVDSSGWIWQESSGLISKLSTSTPVMVTVKCENSKKMLFTRRLSDTIQNFSKVKGLRFLVAKISDESIKNDERLIPQIEEFAQIDNFQNPNNKQIVLILSGNSVYDSCLGKFGEKTNLTISGKIKMMQYGIKPIRTSFISGGQECSTLSQLKTSFSPKDIKESYPQLLKWLVQNKEFNIDKFKGYDFSNNDANSLYDLYCLFFNDYITSKEIQKLTDLYLAWEEDAEYSHNFKLLTEEIRRQDWGTLFGFQLAEQRVSELEVKGVVITQDSLLYVYFQYLDVVISFFHIKIDNLYSLYLFVAAKSCFKDNFDFLDNIIRKQQWHTVFFIHLLPLLFENYFESEDEDDEKWRVVKLDNLFFSVETEQEFFDIYKSFLSEEFAKENVCELSDLFMLLISDQKYKQIFDVFRGIIKDAKWNLDFAYKIIPLILAHIHNVDGNNEFFVNEKFSNGDQFELFHLYNFLLSGFLEEKGEIAILKNLYLFWDRNEEYSNLFFQLHDEIVSTSWGGGFLNSFFSEILHGYTDINRDYYIDEREAYLFYLRHFKFYFIKNKINNISDLYVHWRENPAYYNESCYNCLEKMLLSNLWGAWKLLDIYKQQKKLFNKTEWVKIFEELAKNHSTAKHLLLTIGKVFIDDFHDFHKGHCLLESARNNDDKDIEKYIAEVSDRENVVSKKFIAFFKEYEQLSTHDSIAIDSQYRSNAKTLREKWLLISQEFFHGPYVRKGDVRNILVGIINLEKKDLPYGYGQEDPNVFLSPFINCGFKIWTNKNLRKLLHNVSSYDKKSFFEIRFVLALIAMRDSSFVNEGLMLMKTLKDYYPPAQYILDQSVNDPDFDNDNFRYNSKNDIKKALSTFCRNMYKYAEQR